MGTVGTEPWTPRERVRQGLAHCAPVCGQVGKAGTTGGSSATGILDACHVAVPEAIPGNTFGVKV